MKPPGHHPPTVDGDGVAVGAGRRSGRGREGLLLVDVDPYLRMLIERDIPDVDIIAVGDGAKLSRSLRAGNRRVVVIDLDSPLLTQVLVEAKGCGLVGIASSSQPGWITEDFDDVLVRPVGTEELRRALEALLGRRRNVSNGGLDLSRVGTWIPILRVAAVGVALLAELGRGGSDVAAALAVFASAYAVLRTVWRPMDRTAVLADVVVAAGIIVATGGLQSSYLLFGLVTAAQVGLVARPLPSVMWASGIACAALLGSAVTAATSNEDVPGQLLYLALEFPAVALASGLAARAWSEDRDLAAMPSLHDTATALRQVREVARHRPGSLTIATVAGDLVDEAVRRWDLRSACLLVAEDGNLYELAGAGLPDHRPIVVPCNSELAGMVQRPTTPVDGAALPMPLRRLTSPDERWLCLGLASGELRGVLLLCPALPLPRRQRLALRRFARRCALALQNAHTYGQLQRLAVDDERLRLGADLRDDLIQDLVHLRFELEMLARSGAVDVGAEVKRLADVAGASVERLRIRATELLTSVEATGLAGALREYCRGIDTVVTTDVQYRGDVSPRMTVEDEAALFRLCRQGVAVALRRSAVSAVEVTLRCDDRGVVQVEIRDDGLADPEESDRRRLSRLTRLREMRECAARAGIMVDVTSLDDGRTALRLTRDRSVPASAAAGGPS